MRFNKLAKIARERVIMQGDTGRSCLGGLPMIKISDLIFDYPGHRALDRISLTIEKGSVTALVGSNGAGKTTLMRCIAGLDTPLSGQITVAGFNVIEQPREVHRVLWYLSDFFGLYQELTVA